MSNLAVSEAFGFVVESLPTCPDGSGDLWWDDASYIRYQGWDPYCPDSDLFVLEMTLPSRRYGAAGDDVLWLVTPDYSDRSPVEDAADDADLPF